MIFSGIVYWVYNQDAGGHQVALDKFYQYQTAYWIEKALSVDNLFVFILVFSFFNVPKYLHHKVLFWGVLGAIVLRAIFIFAGVELINKTYLQQFIQNDSMINYAIWMTIGLLSIFFAIKFLRDEKPFLIISLLFGILGSAICSFILDTSKILSGFGPITYNILMIIIILFIVFLRSNQSLKTLNFYLTVISIM